MFVVRTSKPVENLWKNGLFWSRYSFVTHSIDLKPRDWGLGTSCLGRPSGDGLRSPFGRRAVPVWFSHTDKKIIYFMKPNDNQMSFTCDLPQLTAHLCSKLLTYVRKSRTVLDSTLFRILDFQFLLVELGFRIPWAVFRTARPRIPDSTWTFSWIWDSRIQIPLQGRKMDFGLIFFTIIGLQASMFKGHSNWLQSITTEECSKSTWHHQIQE